MSLLTRVGCPMLRRFAIQPFLAVVVFLYARAISTFHAFSLASLKLGRSHSYEVVPILAGHEIAIALHSARVGRCPPSPHQGVSPPCLFPVLSFLPLGDKPTTAILLSERCLRLGLSHRTTTSAFRRSSCPPSYWALQHA